MTGTFTICKLLLIGSTANREDELTSIRRDYYALMSDEDRAGVAAALDDVPDIDPSVRQKVLDMIYGTGLSVPGAWADNLRFGNVAT